MRHGLINFFGAASCSLREPTRLLPATGWATLRSGAICVCITLVAFSIAAAEPVNFVKNPGFEDGEVSPKFWDLCDNLTTFWEKDDARGGKCIRMYTNIDVEEFHQRQKEMKLDKPPAPKKPREIKGAGYDTVGGNDGVSFYSEFIDVKPGMTYTLTADVRTEGGSPKIFVKGYTEMPTDIDDKGVVKKIMMKRNAYKIYLNCAGSKTWKQNTITFCPTHETDGVKWMRVMLFSYWPPQNYWFDNIKIVESGLDNEAPKRWALKKATSESEAGKESQRDIKEAKAVLDVIRKGVVRYKDDIGTYPPNLQALLKNPGNNAWAGPYLMDLDNDPWGNPYHYSQAKDGYVLKSMGPDGVVGGGDDVE